jgi:hypothetical protein
MTTVISVEDRLDKLYNELKRLNYNVYKFSDGVVSDVVIYSGEYNSFNSISSAGIADSDTETFLINGDNLKGSDVQNIIETKLYSPLF